MLSKKIEKSLNVQIQAEFYSSYLYLAMAAYVQSVDLSGFAQWMRTQSQEEMVHAMRLLDYVNDRGGRVVLEAIEKPATDFKSAGSMFEAALKHEQKVTKTIHRLYKAAKDEGDYATEVEMQWFVTEQVEEEKTISGIVEKLKLVGDQPAILFMIDRDLNSRQPRE